MKFIYNNKLYNPKNPTKKLKQLGITLDDVEIIPEVVKMVDTTIDNSIKKYCFCNNRTGETIVSIYDNLDNLKDIINVSEYERVI